MIGELLQRGPEEEERWLAEAPDATERQRRQEALKLKRQRLQAEPERFLALYDGQLAQALERAAQDPATHLKQAIQLYGQAWTRHRIGQKPGVGAGADATKPELRDRAPALKLDPKQAVIAGPHRILPRVTLTELAEQFRSQGDAPKRLTWMTALDKSLGAQTFDRLIADWRKIPDAIPPGLEQLIGKARDGAPASMLALQLDALETQEREGFVRLVRDGGGRGGDETNDSRPGTPEAPTLEEAFPENPWAQDVERRKAEDQAAAETETAAAWAALPTQEGAASADLSDGYWQSQLLPPDFDPNAVEPTPDSGAIIDANHDPRAQSYAAFEAASDFKAGPLENGFIGFFDDSGKLVLALPQEVADLTVAKPELFAERLDLWTRAISGELSGEALQAAAKAAGLEAGDGVRRFGAPDFHISQTLEEAQTAIAAGEDPARVAALLAPLLFKDLVTKDAFKTLLLDILPVIGSLRSVDRIQKAIEAGDQNAAALELGGLLIGVIPIVGGTISKIGRTALRGATKGAAEAAGDAADAAAGAAKASDEAAGSSAAVDGAATAGIAATKTDEAAEAVDGATTGAADGATDAAAGAAKASDEAAGSAAVDGAATAGSAATKTDEAAEALNGATTGALGTTSSPAPLGNAAREIAETPGSLMKQADETAAGTTPAAPSSTTSRPGTSRPPDTAIKERMRERTPIKTYAELDSTAQKQIDELARKLHGDHPPPEALDHLAEIGWDNARGKFDPAEAEIAWRLEQSTGIELRRIPRGEQGGDWYDPRTQIEYDALRALHGRGFSEARFANNLESHLDKVSGGYVIVDLSGLTAPEIAVVRQIVEALPTAARNRVIVVD